MIVGALNIAQAVQISLNSKREKTKEKAKGG
jgi:hypothetical protein